MKRIAHLALVLVALVVAFACQPTPPPNAVYPMGYGGQWATMAQVESATTVRKTNFEMWRRTKAMMEYAQTQGVNLGVGTCWRVQPNFAGPGFAKPGNSNHEGFPADGVSGGAVACDMVPQGSWGWMEANAWRFGLRTFRTVNNEPWHIQPAEIPAGRNYRRVPWVLSPATFYYPSAPVPPPPSTPPPVIVYDPWTHRYGLWPVGVKPTLVYGSGYNVGTTDETTRGAATYLNHVLAFEAGQYVTDPLFVVGIHTCAGMQNVQRFFGLPVDCVIDAQDWAAIDQLART